MDLNRFPLLPMMLMLLLMVGCASPQLPAPPVVEADRLPLLAGVLVGDTTLSGAYLLSGDLLVPEGVELTLLPGTRIYVQPSDSTKIDPEFLSRETEILVRGRLTAVGSRQQPIQLLPLKRTDDGVDWGGIALVGKGTGRLEHVEIARAETGLLCLDASPQVHSSTFVGCRYGIILQQRSAARIVDSRFLSGEAGILCWDESRPLLQGNLISDNQEEGLYIAATSRPQLLENEIRGNDLGLVMSRIQLLSADNHVAGNRVDRHYLPAAEGGD